MSQVAQHYHVFETAMGFCAIAWSNAGIARFQLPVKSAEAADRLMRRRADGAEPEAPPKDVAAVVAAAKRYFDGEETDFSHVRLDVDVADAFFTQIYALPRSRVASEPGIVYRAITCAAIRRRRCRCAPHWRRHLANLRIATRK